MSCGFSTIVPGAILITVFTLGELEEKEIDKIKLLLNTSFVNEYPKKEWCQFSVHNYKVAECIWYYEFMTTERQTLMSHSLVYFLK